jgi:hypothetical protein
MHHWYARQPRACYRARAAASRSVLRQRLLQLMAAEMLLVTAESTPVPRGGGALVFWYPSAAFRSLSAGKAIDLYLDDSSYIFRMSATRCVHGVGHAQVVRRLQVVSPNSGSRLMSCPRLATSAST